MSSENDVAQAVDSILEHGDPIDRNPNVRLAPVRLGGMAAAGALGVPAGLYFGEAIIGYGVENLLANGIYVPVAYASVGIANRLHNTYQVRRDEKLQVVIREALDEPVDLYRYGKRGERNVALRWYGLDVDSNASTTFNVDEMVERSQKIIDFANKHKIAAIIVNAEPFSDLITEDEYEDGATVISGTKHTRYRVIKDKQAAETVIIKSVEEFTSLVEAYQDSQRTTLVEAIVTALNNPQLAMKYGLYKDKNNNYERRELYRAVRQIIELQSDDAESQPFRTPDGVVHRRKVHLSSIVMGGGRSSQLAHGHDLISGQQRLDFAGISELATIAGMASNKVLLESLQQADLARKPKMQLLIGLCLLLQNGADAETISVSPNLVAQSRQAGISAMFERAAKGDKDNQVYFSQQLRNERIMTKLLSRSAAVLAGIALGATIHVIGETGYDREDSRYNAYAKAHHFDPSFTKDAKHDEHYKEYEVQSGFAAKFDRYFSERYVDLLEADNWASYAVADFLIDDLQSGGLAQYLPYYGQHNYDRQLNKLNLSTPANWYAESDGSMHMGDVKNNQNKVVYSVTPLTDESSAGYWFSSIEDTLALNNGQDPLKGASLAMEDDSQDYDYGKILHFSHDQATILAQQPDFEIETPYVGIDKTINSNITVHLPVMQNMAVVGARIIDRANPDDIIYPDIRRNAFGLYSYNMYGTFDNPIVEHKMDDPVLQYWVKRQPNTAMAEQLATSHLGFDDTRSYGSDSVKYHASINDRRVLAISVRKALGLSADANAQQVLKTIRDGKLYAYEPFDYDDVHVDLSHDGDMAALGDLGYLLAKLDTANCNVATLTQLLATLDEQAYNGATGFDDNGDGKLIQSESHAWLMDTQANIVDATPTKMAPGVIPRNNIDKSSDSEGGNSTTLLVERSAEILLGGILLAFGYRKRQRLGRMSDTARTKAVLAWPSMQQTIARLQHERYAPPHSTYVVSLIAARPVTHVAQAYSRTISNIQISGQKPIGRAERARRVLLRLNDRAIRRYVHLGK